MKKLSLFVIAIIFFYLNTVSAQCTDSGEKKVSIEGSFSWTHVSNSSNWLYDYQKVKYIHSDKFDLSLYHEGFSRWSLRDDLVGLGTKVKPFELTALVFDIYYVPGNDFLARTRTMLEVFQNFWWHEQLVFSFGYSFFDFGDKEVAENTEEYVYINMLTPGVEYYFPLGLFAGYKAFLVLNRDNELVHAHMGYLSYDNPKYLLATIGFSLGDEFASSFSSTGVNVRNFFGKVLIKALCPFYFSVMYQHTITNVNDHRNEILLGVRYDF